MPVNPQPVSELEIEAMRRGIPVEQLVRELMLEQYGSVPRADLTTAYNPPVAPSVASPPPTGGEAPYPSAVGDYYGGGSTSNRLATPTPAPVAVSTAIPAAGPSYNYPDAYSWRGNLGKSIGQDIEHYTTKMLQSQAERTVSAHTDLWNRYLSLPDGYEKQAIANDLRMLESQYDQMIANSQTAGAAPRALGTLFEYPSLYPNWEGLKADYSGDLGIEFPQLIGRLTQGGTGMPATTAHDTGFWDTLTPTAIEGGRGTMLPPTVAGATILEGGRGTMLPSGPGYNIPGAGEVPTGGTGKVNEPYGTPGGEGFKTWGQMQEAMGEDYGTIPGEDEDRINVGFNTYWGGGLNQEELQYLLGGYGTHDRISIDLGQGQQDYDVRRDGMGNILSYTPTSDSSSTGGNRLTTTRR